MKGIYDKNNRGWLYYQAPKPPGGVRPKAIALKTKDWAVATREVAKRFSAGLEIEAVHAGTVADLIPRYEESRREDTKPTRRARGVILNGFKDILGNPKVSDLSPAMIAVWRDHLDTKGGTLNGRGKASPTTRRSYLITVKAFLTWCRREGHLQHDPLIDVKHMAKVRKTRVLEFHTVEERERVLAVAAKDYVGLILHLGYFAGLRHEEMLAFHAGWLFIGTKPDGEKFGSISVQDTAVEYDDGTRGTWTPKGKRARTIPLHPRLLAFLENYGIRRPWMLAPDRPLWPGEKKNSKRFDPKKALKNVAKKAAVAKLNYHLLRHTAATHLVLKGVALSDVAAFLGDGLRVTEETYAGYLPTSSDIISRL